ncbi:hypothetical protein L0U85_13530 [Glycomyces sp. L485]|uniref:hypothetical protein n=1 Tax=Glycomyces sp. L485 TaxID=2909235 RepID=UPI001F4AF811|nr:hypothetical protein [Glycomyces sp. L485]MCH7231867.1 hypothetical protein [Glycomyces sp. L485]
MEYQQERADDYDEASEFDLADSAEDDDAEQDPETYAPGGGEGAVPEEANDADAAEQAMEVPVEDDEPYEG